MKAGYTHTQSMISFSHTVKLGQLWVFFQAPQQVRCLFPLISAGRSVCLWILGIFNLFRLLHFPESWPI